jgi:hypothetical protein
MYKKKPEEFPSYIRNSSIFVIYLFSLLKKYFIFV